MKKSKEAVTHVARVGNAIGYHSEYGNLCFNNRKMMTDVICFDNKTTITILLLNQ